MNLSDLSPTDLLDRCAWCHQLIPEGNERFGTGLRVRPEHKARMAALEGQVLPLQLATGREIIVMVTRSDSPAHAAGDDLFMQTCSEECGRQIGDAVRSEIA